MSWLSPRNFSSLVAQPLAEAEVVGISNVHVYIPVTLSVIFQPPEHTLPFGIEETDIVELLEAVGAQKGKIGANAAELVCFQPV